MPKLFKMVDFYHVIQQNKGSILLTHGKIMNLTGLLQVVYCCFQSILITFYRINFVYVASTYLLQADYFYLNCQILKLLTLCSFLWNLNAYDRDWFLSL